jgi:hypothetical protein
MSVALRRADQAKCDPLSRRRARSSATNRLWGGTGSTGRLSISVLGFTVLLGAVLFAAVNFAPRLADACPFCEAVSLTFCEEIASADVAVVAKLVSPAATTTKPAELGKARFEIVEQLKGDKSLEPGKKVEAFYFGDSPVGSLFVMMITGGEPGEADWSRPIPITPRGREYLSKALKLPAEGPDRMVFFQDYLEDADELLARDAYDEFAKTNYAGIKELKSRIDHDKLIAWIQDPKVTASHRRLYLCMLGVCGQQQDVALLETMLRSDDRQIKAGLDSLIAAYLTLRGPEGMPLIEDLFLKKHGGEDGYTETYSAIMALRFHGQEETVIPRSRLVEALHYVLDDPQEADLVIADLARWQDWGAMDQLVELFKKSTDENSWIRVPVINYLQACPLPEAKERLAELTKLDPDSIKKATTLFAIGNGPASPDPAATAEDQETDTADTSDTDTSDSNTSAASAEASAIAKEANAGGDPAGEGQSAGARLSTAEEASGGITNFLVWMALVGCAIGIAFWVVLGGSRKAA